MQKSSFFLTLVFAMNCIMASNTPHEKIASTYLCEAWQEQISPNEMLTKINDWMEKMNSGVKFEIALSPEFKLELAKEEDETSRQERELIYSPLNNIEAVRCRIVHYAE